MPGVLRRALNHAEGRTTIRFATTAMVCASFLVVESAEPLRATVSNRTFTVTRFYEDWVVPANVTAVSVDAKGADSPGAHPA